MIKQFFKKIPFLPQIYRFLTDLFKRVHIVIIEWIKMLVIDTNKIEHTIFIVGSPRSGTTWISNLLNHTNDYRYIFEPFREEIIEMKPFGPQPFVITPEMDIKEIESSLRKILSGKLKLTKWLNRFNNRFYSDKRIIKAIRPQFFLKWLAETFPEVKIIYIMRHPIACSLSKVNKESGWKIGKDFMAHPLLFERYLSPFKEIIESAKTPFENHVTAWCVQNYIALQELEGKPYLLVYYEDFCIKPEITTKEMIDFANARFDRDQFIKRIQEKFIITEKSAILNNENLVLNWKNKVTSEEIAFALKAVRAFGLDAYYTENPYPLKSHIINKD